MGIKKIKKFLDTYAPDAIQVKQIDDYKNKTVAIDILNMLYRSVIAIRKQGYDIYNDNCQVSVTHIHALLNKIIGLHKYNIKGVCVFDGIPPDIKLDALDKRRLRKKKILNIYDTLSEEEKKKYYYIQHAVTSYEIFECKLLLRICGFPIIDAPQESDSQCAYLSKKGIVQYIISDDSDILLFGGKNIIKNFSVDKRKKMYEISLKTILKDSKLTYTQFVDVCLKLGTDYNIKNKNKNNKIVREYILNPVVTKKINVQQRPIKFKYLEEFLKIFNFKQDYIDNVIAKLKS